MPYRISEWDLRKLFNTHIQPLIDEGELAEYVASDPPAGAEYNQPPGTTSQTVWIIRQGTFDKVAICHRFARPDGTVSKLDPKWIHWDNVKYAALR